MKTKQLLTNLTNIIDPIVGPDNLQEVRKYIRKAGLRLPSFREVLHLVYTAHKNYKIKYFRDLVIKFHADRFWTSTGVLYMPKGVYINDNPCRSGNGFLDEGDLISKLKRSDKNGMYLPYGSYCAGHIDTSELTQNRFILALTGKEGSKRLEFIARENERDWKGEKKSTYLAALTKLPEIFNKKPQARHITFGCWDTDYGGLGGAHINTLVENYDLNEIKAYGIGVEK
ncbi:hypothetical protein A3K73_04385 [Candidatus Pacearchaeota archaeon RBG_13_36_9]|nr:MAG: hypothetical protein A3K73_04385 [Candidatus Pacearchaeota archaeon RBG_13_36_9]